MNILNSIRLLYCLNESGVNKAYELLEGLMHSQEYRQNSVEQLQQEILEEQKGLILKAAKKEDEKEIRETEIRKQYEKEFMMIGTQKEFWNQRDIFEAIDIIDKESLMKITSAFNWGYIQGKKTERARRKKVSI